MAEEEELSGEPPDLFRAATNDDFCELAAAIADGQSLDERSGEFYLMTPVHLACVKKSKAFLRAVVSYEFNAWSRDSNGRLSMDHAVAQGLEEEADLLLAKLYPTSPSGKPLMPF